MLYLGQLLYNIIKSYLIESCPGAPAESFGTVLLLVLEATISFALLCASCLPCTDVFMVAPFIHLCSKSSPLSSVDPPFADRVSGHAQSQDKWPVPLHGHSLKPTTQAQYLHVEQEQATESVHNDFKVDRAIFAASLLTTCAWRKKEENQMYRIIGWKFFAQVCSRFAVTQCKDMMPDQGSQQWL